MKEKWKPLHIIAVTAMATVLATLALTAAVLFLLLGKTGLGMTQAMFLINTQFVGDCDLQKAADAALNTLVTELGDRWSYYVDETGLAGLKESQENAYVGIGVTISYQEDGLLVIAVVEDGPAQQGGLFAGDLILTVDGIVMEGDAQTRTNELVRGLSGSTVALTVRGEDQVVRSLSITRGRVYEHPVSYQLLENGTGLITMKNFNRRSGSDAIAAVNDLVMQGATGLAFDVRNNGGGYLDELTRLLSRLLPEQVIFRAGDRAGRSSFVRSDENCVNLPMAVLVNGNTYSAAEFFAAALQEANWGVVVGTATFGKGYSQQTFSLISGGAINISTATYFTGEGVSLIGTGLSLDKEVPLSEEQSALLAAKALEPAEDPQLQAALLLLEKGELK